MWKRLRQPERWLAVTWKTLVRLVVRTPRGHVVRPLLLDAMRIVEGRYWRRMQARHR
jgi:hypothetical protein